MALTSCVRCRTSNSRAESTTASACCSADFTGTLGMSGRAAASLIASASLRSFLPRRTNGFTYCGGISCTVWPMATSRRPQWCEPPHASSATCVGGSLAKRLLLGSGVVTCPSRHQAGDERSEQGFAASACVVHELEEAEMNRQLVLRNGNWGKTLGTQLQQNKGQSGSVTLPP